MKSSKLYLLFNTLDEKERKLFKAFVRTSFAKTTDKAIELCDFLCENAESGKGKEPSKEKAYKVLFGKGPYNDSSVRLLMSDLLKGLNRFLAIIALQQNPEFEQLMTLRQWGERGLEQYFFREVKKSREKFTKSGEIQSPLFGYLLESEVIRYRDQNPRSLPSHFQNAVDALDQWYILEKIKFACTMVNNSAVLDTEVDIPLLKEISRHIEAMGNGNSPLILIYFRILKMLQDPGSPQQYTLFKNLLLEYAGNLPEEESRDIYTLAQNYCIRQINRGRGEFLEELFLIYESLLERGLLLENGALSPWHVKNITAVALRLKKFDWTAKFLEEKIEFVAPQFRQNAQTYNLAKLYFQKGEYSEVKKLLLQVEYEDVFYNLDSKSMLLKIYFEEGEDVALDALCRSFLAYIKRNKLISEAHRTVYRNLVRYVQRLNRLDGLGKKQLSDMLEEVESNSAVSDSSWLKRMIRIRISS